MIDDIRQIIKSPVVSQQLIEKTFSVKLDPYLPTTTRVVQVYKGECAQAAVNYDHVEYRQYANNTRFFLIVYLHGKHKISVKELEAQMGSEPIFKVGNPAQKELNSLVFTSNSKTVEYCVDDKLTNLVFFTLEGNLNT